MVYRLLTQAFAGRGAARGARIAGVGVVLIAAALTLVGCPTSGPRLRVNPLAVDFGPEATARSFTITNGGGAPLVWSVSDVPAWLEADPGSGTLAAGSQVVTLMANREGLSEGRTQAEFRIASNGGDQILSASIATPTAGVLSVDPETIDLGAGQISGAFTVANNGGLPVSWEIIRPDDAAWIDEIAPESGVTQPDATTAVTFTVSRAGLAAGFYTADLIVRSGATERAVRITLTVPGASGVLEATPTVVDFGPRWEELAVTLRNAGEAELHWETSAIQYPDATPAPWLSVVPAVGPEPLAPSASTQLTLLADRSALPDGEYAATFDVRHVVGDSVTASIPVTVRIRVQGPQLVVAPALLRFGENAFQKIISVSNGGAGEVAWQAAFVGEAPSWLSISPVSGVVAEAPQSVLASVDRSGLDPGEYAATLRFSAEDGAGQPLPGADVTVTMGVAKGNPPQISIAVIGPDGESIVSEGVDLELQVGALLDDTTRTLRIGNAGDDELTWGLDAGDLPGWLTVSPTSGTTALIPNEVSVTVYVEDLPAVPAQHTLAFSSNGANNGGAASVVVKATRRQRSLIGAAPGTLSFGTGLDSDGLEVFNLAPQGERLDFMVTSDAPWLLTMPQLGTSFGTDPPGLDRQPVLVAVNRRCLTASGELGFIRVEGYTAEGSGPDRVIKPDPTIAPVEIPVTVEAQPLGIRAAVPWARQPSLIRFPFIMYDRAISPIRVPDAAALADRLTVYEDGAPLEYTETSLYVTDDYRINLIVLLDYSGSMFAAAQEVEDPVTPAGPDPLHDMYVDAVTREVFENTADLPQPTTQIALWAVYDRHQPLREVHGFTNDRQALIDALGAFVAPTHGASELLPAVDAAAAELFLRETAASGFADGVINAVLFVTDGRDTTPPAPVNATIILAQTLRARLFNVSWGKETADGFLALLSNGTQGQLYPTSSVCVPGQGPALTRSGLADGLAMAVRDLGSHYVMTYTTLNEQDGVPVRFEARLEHGGEKISGSSAEYLLDLSTISPVR